MSRSVWKGVMPYTNNSSTRSCTVTPTEIGKTIKVHNGSEFKSLSITSSHVGHKLGEFVHTKIPAVFKRKNKKLGKS